MDPAVACTAVADRSRNLIPLLAAGGLHVHHSASGASLEFQTEPVVLRRRRIAQQERPLADASDHDVDAAVVIEIAKGRSPVERRPPYGRCIEAAVGTLHYHEVRLFVPLVEVAVGRKQILPAIVIKVEDTVTPSGGPHGRGAHSRPIGESPNSPPPKLR